VNTYRTLAVAAATAAAVAALATPASAAPAASPQHPPTFEVLCDGELVVTLEATGAAGFTVGSGVQGADSVIVSAEGAIYDTTSGEVVYSFQKTWGKRQGMSTITCTRDDTAGQYRVSETFVIALLPSR
jgi:hypothetical protein